MAWTHLATVAVALLAAASAQSLQPLQWRPLNITAVRPEGWLWRELRLQGDGLLGGFRRHDLFALLDHHDAAAAITSTHVIHFSFTLARTPPSRRQHASILRGH